MNEKTPITGGCLCGSIRYEATMPPNQVGYCHCNMCKKSTGGLFGVSAMFNSEYVRFKANELSWFASSASAERGFCSQCGSPIAWRHKESGITALWHGSLDNPEDMEPEGHYNLAEKIQWVDIQDNLPDATEQGISRQQGTYDKD
ncbi:MAG: GFA family protein [Rhodospirillales bacterium]|jgi:hypothetical protein|nr:GFA family protein [Rhodospirillales bacterium]MBT4626325.1 GFA family protein [Rhodospirillales bacterium]MBT5350229.1 GFA family protein [Rhodospirillales bacterium]MBT5520836.1 GFA family protein [Rhodospirillales bacterium]MBT6110707.1 GFA family protein [Rhodospirillales bacterium]